MRDCRHGRSKLKPAVSIGVRLEGLSDVEQLLVAQSDDWPAHQDAKGRCVQWVRECAYQDQQILQLLQPEQGIARLGATAICLLSRARS